MRAAARLAALSLASLVFPACYTLQPVQNQPTPLGTILSLSINDAGRVGLAEQMGTGVSDVEGRLLLLDSVTYVLAVSQVETQRFGTQVWSGERVSFNRTYVNQANVKRFSRSRTAILSAAAVGLVVAVATQKLFGSANNEPTKTPPDTSLSNRIPAFLRR